MSQPETIWVSKSVLSDGKVEKILGFSLPLSDDWMGFSGRWRGIRIDAYYVHRTEKSALDLARKRIADQIASNEARNQTLAALTVHMDDLTKEDTQAAE